MVGRKVQSDCWYMAHGGLVVVDGGVGGLGRSANAYAETVTCCRSQDCGEGERLTGRGGKG